VLDNIARQQAFLRFAGWTWVCGGLGFSIAWLVLPIDAAETVGTTVVLATIGVTVVQLLRLRKPRRPAPGLN
jgi:hypothetical protein